MTSRPRFPHLRNVVVQRYTSNPLLIGGHKFDCRVYIAITNINPLIGYVYDEGLARFASQPFAAPTTENEANAQMHLTNFAVNSGPNHHIQRLENGQTSKWALSELFAYLEKHPPHGFSGVSARETAIH